MGRGEEGNIYSIVLAIALINTSIPPKEVEASWFSDICADICGGLFTIITAPIWVFCQDNPTFRKNNPFKQKLWQEYENPKDDYKLPTRLPTPPHHNYQRDNSQDNDQEERSSTRPPLNNPYKPTETTTETQTNILPSQALKSETLVLQDEETSMSASPILSATSSPMRDGTTTPMPTTSVETFSTTNLSFILIPPLVLLLLFTWQAQGILYR